MSYPFPTVPHNVLEKDIKADIAIIGAGVSGAMLADALARAGFSVVMLDRREPLHGATAATTALLQYEIDQPLIHLMKQIGHDKAIRAWRRSKMGAVNLTARIQALRIDCSPQTQPSLYLAGNMLDRDGLRQEQEARNAIGLYTQFLSRKELGDKHGIRRNAALKTFDTLSVNPVQLAAGLLHQALQNKTRLFSPANVDDIETSHDGVRVLTKEGPVVTARYAIWATGYEIPKFIHTKRHKINSTWAIATKRQPGKIWPEASLVWEASDPYLYIRATKDGRVICGGEDEDFTDEDKRDALLPRKTKTLERKLGALFPQLNPRAEFSWAGSFGGSVTALPSVGQVPGMKNCLSVMAYGGNGIIYSQIASELILSLLTGKDDPEADIYAFPT